MSAGDAETAGLAEFAKAHGLRFAAGGSLPAKGGLLNRDSLVVDATATGMLRPGAEGTLALVTYTYRSNDTTHTARATAALIAVPESIAFAPYIADAGTRLQGIFAGVAAKTVKPGGDLRLYADEGIDDAWLGELFSPALTDWLARSPDGFTWELADGLLVASLKEHRTAESDLARLCEDAAHLAGAIREESLEEVDSGAASASAAKVKPDPQTALISMLAPMVEIDGPPENITSALTPSRELVVRHPSTYIVGVGMAFAFAVGINIIGGGIFGLLLNLPNPLLAVAIFEVVVITTTIYLSVRHEINSRSKKVAAAVFWREFAAEHGLEPIEPRSFSATHAKAEMRGAPERVLVGSFNGVDGALALKGDGLKRGDWIALVAGPAGPVANADFTASAPGPARAVLTTYIERLAGELSASRR